MHTQASPARVRHATVAILHVPPALTSTWPRGCQARHRTATWCTFKASATGGGSGGPSHIHTARALTPGAGVEERTWVDLVRAPLLGTQWAGHCTEHGGRVKVRVTHASILSRGLSRHAATLSCHPPPSHPTPSAAPPWQSSPRARGATPAAPSRSRGASWLGAHCGANEAGCSLPCMSGCDSLGRGREAAMRPRLCTSVLSKRPHALVACPCCFSRHEPCTDGAPRTCPGTCARPTPSASGRRSTWPAGRRRVGTTART